MGELFSYMHISILRILAFRDCLETDTFFFVEVILGLHTAYYSNGLLITSFHQIRKMYFRGWFCCDVISAFPVDWLFLIFMGLEKGTPYYQGMLNAQLTEQ